MTSEPNANVALLIDADNASAQTIDAILTVLAEIGPVNVRRAYGNWTKPALKGWEAVALRHGIELVHQLDYTKGKNASDMKMTLDAMDLLYGRRVSAFGVMSSDSDFTPLVMRLKQEGLPVYGFGMPKSPEAFRQACTRYIDVAGLTGRDKGVAKTGDAADSAAPDRGRRRGPRNGGEDARDEDYGALAPAPLDPGEPLDAELLKLLYDAYGAAKHDQRGFVGLSELGRLAGNRSSFDVRSYGFRRLSDLFEAVPQFQLERREDGAAYVRRMR